MLQWSTLHPYNALQAVRLGAVLDPARCGERLAELLERSGLGSVEVDPGHRRLIYPGGPPEHADPPVLATGPDPGEALRQEIERQLNAPFPFTRRFTPFRFFLVPAAGETTLGLAYFHAVADGVSVSRLMLSAAQACLAEDGYSGPGLALKPSARNSFPLGSPLAALRRSAAAVDRIQALRKSFRPPRWNSADSDVACLNLSVDETGTAAALAAAKEWGVTLNDLFLAALLLAFAPMTPERFGTTRPRLAAGCIVNARPDLPPRRRNGFGMMLGSFTVTHEVPPGISLRDLARDLRDQTEPIKRHRLYLASSLEFLVSRFMFGRMVPDKQRNFYRKSFPIWAGVTNQRAEGLLAEAASLPVLEYHRAVSPGPAMPMAVAVTGYRGRLTVCASHRAAVLPRDQAAEVLARFHSLVSEPAAPA